MNPKNIALGVVYLALIAIIAWQQVVYNKLEAKFEEEKILFDANYGEVIRLKDDIGAYADSLRLLRRDFEKLKIYEVSTEYEVD